MTTSQQGYKAPGPANLCVFAFRFPERPYAVSMMRPSTATQLLHSGKRKTSEGNKTLRMEKAGQWVPVIDTMSFVHGMQWSASAREHAAQQRRT